MTRLAKPQIFVLLPLYGKYCIQLLLHYLLPQKQCECAMVKLVSLLSTKLYIHWTVFLRVVKL